MKADKKFTAILKYILMAVIFTAFIISCESEPEIQNTEPEPPLEKPAEQPEETEKEPEIFLFIPTTPLYVIYEDFRINDAYLSIAYIDSDTYLINRKEHESGKTSAFTIKIEIINGVPEPGKISIIEGAMPDIVSIIPDILNMITQRHRTPVDDITQRIRLNDEWDNYTLEHSYNKWIPLFNLYSTETENQSRLQLVKIGALKSSADNNFFDFSPPDEFNETPDYTIENYFNKLQNVNNLALIRLDEYWTPNENKMYILSYDTIMDASIFAEKIDLDELNLDTIDDYIKRALCYQDNYIDTKSISVDIFNNYLTLSYNIYDTEIKNYKKVFNVFIPEENDRVYIIVILHTFLSLYEKNKQYFDKILF
jgi:hypothetical protein